MKKSELKARFRRYSAEEKWQHYFACKKKIKKLIQENKELYDYMIMYHKSLISSSDIEVKLSNYKKAWAELKEKVGKKFNEEENCKVTIAYRKVLTYMQELEEGFENE